MPLITSEQVLDLFRERVPEEEMQTWADQYGASAPFFWAAQANLLQVPQDAQGFYALPPQQQATWYGVHGANAAEQWKQQSQAAGGQQQPAGPAAPAGPTSPVAQNVLGGKYPNTFAGQTVRKGDPGKGAGIGFGQTVAPSTWNAADPSQGRSEGWGSIGAGTAGIQYGKGVLGFGKEQIDIRPEYLKEKGGVFDPSPGVAPGYIPGSGTYNQYDLSKEGLFSAVKGSGSDRVVNARFGLGGTGDPTTGHETQTPQRYITGNMADSGVAEKGDRKARGLGGGAMPGSMGAMPPPPDAAQEPPAAGALPHYQTAYATGGGAYFAPGPGGGGAAEGWEAAGGGGFFGAGPGYSPEERGALWGKDEKTKGLDYLVTLFMRSDTPTGVGTPAWSAPQEYWDGLINAIRQGIVAVKDPGAWQMLQEKGGWTPQSIGGKATDANNIQPNGQPGTGGTGTGGSGPGGTPTDPRWGMGGTWQEGEETPFGPIKGGLPGGMGFEWQKLYQEMQDAAAKNAIEQAKLTGVFNNMPTLQAKELEAQIAYNARMATVAELAENRQLQQQVLDEAFRRAELKFKQGEATGFVDGQATVEMQELMGNLQQEAYERAANPALAFQNELARGATGWNNPGQDPNAVGIPGLTMPGQNMQQFMQAGGFTQSQQPQIGPTAAQGYGYGTYPGAGYAQQAQAQGAAANAAAAAQQTASPYQNVAAQQKANLAPEMQANAAQYGAAAQATPSDPMMTTQAAATNPFAETAAPGTAQGQTGQAAGETGGMSNVLVRTPAAVNAFKAGTGISSSGNYGAATSGVEGAQQALITPEQVRLQNLKQTRKLSPVARAVVGSFGAAGGTDKDTFAMYSDRKAPRAATAAGGYNMR